MITSFSHRALFVSMTFFIPLVGMEQRVVNSKEMLSKKIIDSVEQIRSEKLQDSSDFDRHRVFYNLQLIFDSWDFDEDQSDYLDNPYAYLVEYLKTKKSLEIEELFSFLRDKESTLKMALRMVYGRMDSRLKSKDDLDSVRCHSFFKSGIRHNFSIEIEEKEFFGGQLRTHLKDFLALLQPMVCFRVRKLVIQENELWMLPLTFSCLKELRVLDLSHNRFRDISLSIKRCKYLRELDLRDNKMDQLPQWLIEVENLKKITIDEGVNVLWNEQGYPGIRIIEGFDANTKIVVKD